MNRITKRLLAGLVLTSLLGALAAHAEETPKEKSKRFQEKKEALYQRMAKEGISRELVEEIDGGWADGVNGIHRNGSASVANRITGRISEFGRYHAILAEKVLKPGEHYRFELDEFIVTMVVPDAVPIQSWIVPYADTRTDPRRDQALRESKAGLQVGNLMWDCSGSGFSLFSSWHGPMGVYIYYDATLPPSEKVADVSTPEKLREVSSKNLHSLVPSQAEIDEAKREHMILNSAGNRVVLDTETTVINGRVWTREALNGSYDRLYRYVTMLPDSRELRISISMANFDFNANPDMATYPNSLKRAFAQMDEMVASLRVAKRNDDGSPDPFVIERVEPAPLPIREKSK